MLERLMQHYKHALTTSYSPNDSAYEWFQTELGQTFGILKSSLSETEKELLVTLFHQIKKTNEDNFSVSQQKWYDFLFSEKPIDTPPLAAEQSNVRFTIFI